jgi:hypothetical protein
MLPLQQSNVNGLPFQTYRNGWSRLPICASCPGKNQESGSSFSCFTSDFSDRLVLQGTQTILTYLLLISNLNSFVRTCFQEGTSRSGFNRHWVLFQTKAEEGIGWLEDGPLIELDLAEARKQAFQCDLCFQTCEV